MSAFFSLSEITIALGFMRGFHGSVAVCQTNPFGEP
jgi:hypothetical protein